MATDCSKQVHAVHARHFLLRSYPSETTLEAWLFKTHLTPSYRLFSILDVAPIYRIGAPPLVAVKSATVNGRSVSPFPCVLSGYGWRWNTNSKGNRSSPLYAICLNWINRLQFVGFDSKLFYGRHCQIEPDGEHPTSSERNSSITSLCASKRYALCRVVSRI